MRMLLWHVCPKHERKKKRGYNDEESELQRRDTPSADGRFPPFTLVVLRNKWGQIERILYFALELARHGDDQTVLPPAPVERRGERIK